MKPTAKNLKTIFIILYVLIVITLGILFVSLPKDGNGYSDLIRTLGFLVILAYAFFSIYNRKKRKESEGI